MKLNVVVGATLAVVLLGLGMLAGSVIGANRSFAQTPPSTAQTAQTAPSTAPAQTAPGNNSQAQTAPPAQSTIQAKITQAQAEQAALATSAGATVDHTNLMMQNGT